MSSKSRHSNKRSKSNRTPKVDRQGHQPTDDLPDKIEAMYDKALFSIVAGAVGMQPIAADGRRVLFAAADLHDTVTVLAQLNRAFDTAATTTGNLLRVELAFLADAGAPWVERVRKLVKKGHRLVSPRATAQLIREAIEYCSTDDDAQRIDKSTLVHMMLSVTSEQNMRPEVDGDVPTRQWIREHAKNIGSLGLDETMQVAGTLIPDIVATHLFNDSLQLEMLLSNTHDIWLREWPSRSKLSNLGGTPAESFNIATGVDLLQVVQLGAIIAKLALTQEQIKFHRNQLLELGASGAAIDMLISQMALPINAFQAKLADDRAAGPIGHQRYTLTQYPFLALGDDEFIMLRYSWAIDKLCGNHLFFIAWSALRDSQSGPVAQRFALALNDVFEDVVGEILQRIAARSRMIRKVASEREMQSAWKPKKGELPSVCDWALFAGTHCIVVDATNHPVKPKLAQGLSDWEDYSLDIERTFTEKKFDQLVNTIDQLRSRGSFGDEKIDDKTDFIPLVVVPDAGLPSDPLIEADLMNRSRHIFQHLQPRVFPPGVMQLSHLQLFEGIADHYRDRRGDIVQVIGGWRYAAAKTGVPLQLFLAGNGFELPLSRHMLRTSAEVKKMVASLKNASDE